jgi:disulfide bond formation protein DsbB
MIGFRFASLLGFLVCIGGLLFAIVFLQNALGYEPCPMCIFQRVAMFGAGLIFLLGALHGPRAGGRWVYAILALIAAAIGAGIAGRHVWLQSLPPDQVPACGPTLDYLRDMFPLTEVIAMVLKGDGNCAKIDAQWLGISLPGWTLIAFVGIALYALALPLVSKKANTELR